MPRKKNQPQATVVAKSKRTVHHTGNLQQRDSSNRRVKDESLKDRGGEETMVRLHQVFGGITPTTSAFRETVREQSEDSGRNPLTYKKLKRSDRLSISPDSKMAKGDFKRKLSKECSGISEHLDMYRDRYPRNNKGQ